MIYGGYLLATRFAAQGSSGRDAGSESAGAEQVFGTEYMTSGSWGVTLSLAIAAALQAAANRSV